MLALIRKEHHQNHTQENALRYNYYCYAKSSDNRLDNVWGENARTGKDWSKKDEVAVSGPQIITLLMTSFSLRAKSELMQFVR